MYELYQAKTIPNFHESHMYSRFLEKKQWEDWKVSQKKRCLCKDKGKRETGSWIKDEDLKILFY